MPDAFKKAGYTDVHIVEEQRLPDGDFPTVESPNPEEPAALKMATDLADKINADIVIGTDPDCDRLGIAVRDLDGKMTLLNGNQTMSVMTDFLIKNWEQQGRLNGNQFVGSTIVSSNLVSEIAESYGVESKGGFFLPGLFAAVCSSRRRPGKCTAIRAWFSNISGWRFYRTPYYYFRCKFNGAPSAKPGCPCLDGARFGGYVYWIGSTYWPDRTIMIELRFITIVCGRIRQSWAANAMRYANLFI